MIVIEQVKPQEIDKVREVLLTTWRETYKDFYPQDALEKAAHELHSTQTLLKQAQDPNLFFAAAKEVGEIIGVITVEKKDEQTLFIGRITVHPHHQGKGIGTKLIEAAKEHFSGVTKMKVECEKRNKSSCAFYLKRGFTIVGEKDTDVFGTPTKKVIFEKQL